MPLDLSAKRFLDKLAALNPPSVLSQSVADRRDALHHMLAFTGSSVPVGEVQDRSVPGAAGPVRVRVYSPAGASLGPLPGLIYFHGGGLLAGSLDSHDGIGRSLCQASGCRVMSLDYRLAPEHRFPAAIMDGLAATSFLRTHADDFGVDPYRVGLCGDSAGATLAAVIAQQLSAREMPGIALQVLLCPILDLAGRTESRRTLAEGYLVDESTLEHDLKFYLAEGVDAADPRVSPLRAVSVMGLPPSCIHTAEFDPLRDEGRLYADRLRQAGVPTRYTCHPGMIHLFYGMGKLMPYAATAWHLIGTDIRAMFAMAEDHEGVQ